MIELKETTITEALADLKTSEKKKESKRQFISTYLMRQETLKDPLEKEGGTFKRIEQEMQAINDLDELTIRIRKEIARSNQANVITIGDETRAIADWLVWKREIAPTRAQFLRNIATAIDSQRRQLMAKGIGVTVGATSDKPNDVVAQIDEGNLQKQIEHIEEVLGTLDGLLSLKNATIKVHY